MRGFEGKGAMVHNSNAVPSGCRGKVGTGAREEGKGAEGKEVRKLAARRVIEAHQQCCTFRLKGEGRGQGREGAEGA